jgi:integrase
MITDQAIKSAIREAKTACHANWKARKAAWQTRMAALKPNEPRPKDDPEPKLLPIKRCYDKGLYLEVHSTGAALWRFKFALEGREKLISLGSYAEVPLKAARERRDEARKLVADGIDPSAQRKAAKVAQANSVQLVSQEWLDKQTDLDPGTIRRHRGRLVKFIYPYIGKRPIAAVTPPELLAPLRRIEAQGKHDTAKRTRELCGAIWRYAIATGRADRDISADLRGALTPAVSTNHAALTDPKRVGELLRAIDGYVGQPVTCYALKFAPLTFVRPGELRKAEWAEFDLDSPQPLWRIPGPKMKMRDAHVVPLSTQAVEILRLLEPHTAGGKYVFPSLRSGGRPMSENTINAGLRRLGYANEEQTGHGFRTIASTLLNELGWNTDLIELQLAHKERNKSRQAYNKAVRIEERRLMMQAWADHLDVLREDDKKVVPIRSGAGSQPVAKSA